MTSNSFRTKSAFALDRLEARTVPAAYGWEAGLVFDPPTGIADLAIDTSSSSPSAFDRLASNGPQSDVVTTNPNPMTAFDRPDLPNDGPWFANNTATGGAAPSRDDLQARNGVVGNPDSNTGVAGLFIDTTGMNRLTAGSFASDTPSVTSIAPAFGDVRFAKSPTGLAVKDWIPPATSNVSSPPFAGSFSDLSAGQFAELEPAAPAASPNEANQDNSVATPSRFLADIDSPPPAANVAPAPVTSEVDFRWALLSLS